MTPQDPSSPLDHLQEVARHRERAARERQEADAREEVAVISARLIGTPWRTIADQLGADRETLRRKYQSTALAAGAAPSRMKRCTERTKGGGSWCRKGATITVAPPRRSREEPRQVCQDHARSLYAAGWRKVTT